jgi:hypothetical protein
MVSNADNNPNINIHTYGLKFSSICIVLIFLLSCTVLNSGNEYGLKKVGLAISEKSHHNSKSINIFNTDKTGGSSSHKSNNIKKSSSNHHRRHPNSSLSSPTSNGKFVILTFGDTIKSQVTAANRF